MINADSPDASDGCANEDRGISPKLDAALDLLSNRRRRYVLYYLRDRGAVAVDELAERVAAWETDADPKRVRADLHHGQLPRLESAGVVEFDPEANLVRFDGEESPLSEYLDLAAREENVG